MDSEIMEDSVFDDYDNESDAFSPVAVRFSLEAVELATTCPTILAHTDAQT